MPKEQGDSEMMAERKGIDAMYTIYRCISPEYFSN